MRSLSRTLKVGQLKLRGKREVVLSCGCCVARNLRHKALDIEHRKEIKNPVFVD